MNEPHVPWWLTVDGLVIIASLTIIVVGIWIAF
jgi:hypothetical protein